MFGKVPKELQELESRAVVFRMMAAACTAVDLDGAAGEMRRHLGSILLATMQIHDSGPEGGHNRGMWDVVWRELGGDLGNDWIPLSNMPCEPDAMYPIAESLFPLLSVPRSEVPSVFAGTIGPPLFGVWDLEEMDDFQRAYVQHAGLTLVSTHGLSAGEKVEERERRDQFACIFEASFLLIAAEDHFRKNRWNQLLRD